MAYNRSSLMAALCSSGQAEQFNKLSTPRSTHFPGIEFRFKWGHKVTMTGAHSNYNWSTMLLDTLITVLEILFR